MLIEHRRLLLGVAAANGREPMWNFNWRSVLVGYGENQALDTEDDFGVIGRQLFVKLSYAFKK